jgi:hypothetical protein
MILKNLSLTLLLAASLAAQTATTAGRFHVEHPTLHNLGFDWLISGDSNRNAESPSTAPPVNPHGATASLSFESAANAATAKPQTSSPRPG